MPAWRRLMGMSFLTVLCVPAAALAQITLDGSFGGSGKLIGPNYRIGSDLGIAKGGNLFFSFGDFNIRSSESATFFGPGSFDNVVARVTGGRVSAIDGLLRSEIPGAHLYLLNPAGILFGAHARLDVQGSFHASTAHYLKLADGGVLHASLGRTSNLTVAPPVAFGFLGPSVAPITVQSGAELAIPAGQTLSLTAGDIVVDGATLRSPSGRVALIGVASAGEIPFGSATVTDFGVGGFNKLGEISLINGATIDTSGHPTGSVVIRGGQILIADSLIQNTTEELGVGRVGGGVVITATDSISMRGQSSNERGVVVADGAIDFDSKDFTLTGGARVVSAESVTVNARDSINVSMGFLGTETFGGGAGSVSLSAPSIVIEDQSAVFSFGFLGFGRVNISGTNVLLRNGGRAFSAGFQGSDVTIQATESFTLGQNGGVFTSGILPFEEGGSIRISAPVITLDGSRIDAGPGQFGKGGNIILNSDALFMARGAVIGNNAVGDFQTAGTIAIRATRLISMLEGSRIEATSDGFADSGGGTISLSAPSITLDSGSVVSTASKSAFFGAGFIDVEAGTLRLLRGSQIRSDNLNGFSEILGGIRVRSGTVTISGAGSGIFTETTGDNSGPGGNIKLSAGVVELLDGAAISSRSRGVSGFGGNISILADVLRMRRAEISTDATLLGAGGNITLGVGRLVQLEESKITATVGVFGGGGNITISADAIVLNQSRIQADAFNGFGGNITIDGRFFLTSPDSLVTASSALGVAGTVAIGAEITNISGALTPLPEDFVSGATLLRTPCARRVSRDTSRFVEQGRAGLPLEPGQALPSPLELVEVSSTEGPALRPVANFAPLVLVAARCTP